jgi:hypothetical protein
MYLGWGMDTLDRWYRRVTQAVVLEIVKFVVMVTCHTFPTLGSRESKFGLKDVWSTFVSPQQLMRSLALLASSRSPCDAPTTIGVRRDPDRIGAGRKRIYFLVRLASAGV